MGSSETFPSLPLLQRFVCNSLLWRPLSSAGSRFEQRLSNTAPVPFPSGTSPGPRKHRLPWGAPGQQLPPHPSALQVRFLRCEPVSSQCPSNCGRRVKFCRRFPQTPVLWSQLRGRCPPHPSPLLRRVEFFTPNSSLQRIRFKKLPISNPASLYAVSMGNDFSYLPLPPSLFPAFFERVFILVQHVALEYASVEPFMLTSCYIRTAHFPASTSPQSSP